MRRLLFLIGVVIIATQAQGILAPIFQTPPAIIGVTPAVVDVYSSSNSGSTALGAKTGNTCATDAFCTHLSWPNPSGNAVVVFETYGAAATHVPTITTFLADGTATGDTYTACGSEAHDSTNTRFAGAFYDLTPTTNTFLVRSTWGAAVDHAGVVAISVDNANAFDVCNAAASTSSVTTFPTGSITTTAGNDLLLSFVCKTSGYPGSGGFTAGSQAGITWQKESDMDGWTACAAQSGVLTSAGTINPQMTATNGGAYVGISVALKAGSSGSTPTFYVDHAADFTLVGNNTGTQTLLFPFAGSTLYSANQCGPGSSGTELKPTGFTDTSSNTWRKTGPDVWDGTNGNPFGNSFWAEGVSGSHTLSISVATTGTGDCSFWVKSITGAAAHPLAAHYWNCSTDTNITNCPIVTDRANTASFNPYQYALDGTHTGNYSVFAGSGTSGAVIAFTSMGVNFNTAIGMSSPSGANFYCNTTGGENLDGPWPVCQNNGDAMLVNTGNGAQTYTWTMTSSVDQISTFSNITDSFIASGSTPTGVVGRSTSGCVATSSGTSLTCTYTTHATGNMVAITVGTTATSGNITVSDSNSNTITICSGATCSGSTNACVAVASFGCMKQFYIASLNSASLTAGGGTLTFTFPTDTFREAWTEELTGVTALDKAQISSPTISAGVSTGTAVSTTAANEVAVVAALCSGSCTPASGYALDGWDETANVWHGQVSEHKLLTASGSVSGVINDDGSGQDGNALMTFK